MSTQTHKHTHTHTTLPPLILPLIVLPAQTLESLTPTLKSLQFLLVFSGLLYCNSPSPLSCLIYTGCQSLLVSPRGIAMPNDLYFTTVASSSFFFFFRRLISAVTEWISTKLGHIFTYDCYLKNFVRIPPDIYSPLAGGQKPLFWDRLNFDQTYLCNGTRHQQFKKNLSIYTGTPLHSPKFGELL